ncbi:MAG: hypothetical protein JWO78_555 [Micavibrio sp.]|nr:hypothetical protein [Micavibrio sp.]
MPGTALAEKPVTQKVANTYYTSCMGHEDPRMDAEGQMSLCSCAAARMMGELTLEDITYMSADPANKDGRARYNKMLVNVYGPCMKLPVQKELAAQCMRDKKIKQFMLRDTTGMCECMAARTGDYIDAASEDIMLTILQAEPKVTDIFPRMMGSQRIRGAAENFIYTCMHDQK